VLLTTGELGLYTKPVKYNSFRFLITCLSTLSTCGGGGGGEIKKCTTFTRFIRQQIHILGTVYNKQEIKFNNSTVQVERQQPTPSIQTFAQINSKI
jgi:hypothetical protein